MKRWFAIAAVLAVACVLPLLLSPTGYWIRVLTFTLLFAAMAQAWNIIGGLANQTSLGHAAFFGIGAYTSTLLLLKFGISPWLGMLAGGVLGGVAALIIAIPTMRLQGHYFALATLAFGEVMRVIANVWAPLTGGPVGISVPFVPPNPANSAVERLIHRARSRGVNSRRRAAVHVAASDNSSDAMPPQAAKKSPSGFIDGGQGE